MKFRPNLTDPESIAWWQMIERKAREYDELPTWQKGILGGSEEPDNEDRRGEPASPASDVAS